MLISTATAETILTSALGAIRRGGDGLNAALDALPAPIYVTDADGVVTHFNTACIGFTGRTPKVGKDRWCVTWRLYTDEGEYLPHAECPMALAIKSGRPVRGVTAVAERPDGTRVSFLPLPTPVLDEAGSLVGAVNMLIDVTDARQIAELRAGVRRCLRLIDSIDDRRTVETLRSMAREYEDKAAELEQRAPLATVAG
ncbi:MAG TPA: PAS domain-containing protein [Caulobacteraceae bacterium]|nr:PAS domain-containing protein [Caulobacteraceae bacterium]